MTTRFTSLSILMLILTACGKASDPKTAVASAIPSIEGAYVQALGRGPTASEYQNARSELLSGRSTLGELAVELFKRRSSREQGGQTRPLDFFIQSVLGRSSEPADWTTPADPSNFSALLRQRPEYERRGGRTAEIATSLFHILKRRHPSQTEIQNTVRANRTGSTWEHVAQAITQGPAPATKTVDINTLKLQFLDEECKAGSPAACSAIRGLQDPNAQANAANLTAAMRCCKEGDMLACQQVGSLHAHANQPPAPGTDIIKLNWMRLDHANRLCQAGDVPSCNTIKSLSDPNAEANLKRLEQAFKDCRNGSVSDCRNIGGLVSA